MDRARAMVVLGVADGTGADDLRAAFRQALRDTHPDHHGGSSEATRAVVAAYHLLAGSPPAAADPAPSAPVPSPASPPAAVVVDGDTVAAELPAGDLFALLHEAGHLLGEVSYLDPHAGLLEVVVDVAGYGACSVVLTLQGRATGVTEASCTVEPLGAGPAPPPEAVAARLGEALRSLVDDHRHHL